MSKKTESAPKQPAHIVELLTKGTTVITAKTREELAAMVDAISVDCKYGAGAVGYNAETGLFSLRLDVIADDDKPSLTQTVVEAE